MTNKTTPASATMLPLDIARETFKQMASRRVVPTPDNYLLIYNEIAGIPVPETLDVAFKKAIKQIPHETSEQVKWVSRWEKMLKKNDWSTLPDLLSEGMDVSVNFSTQWPTAIRELLQAWDAKQSGLDAVRKKEALEKVLINFGNDPTLAQKITAVASAWQGYGAATKTEANLIALVDDEKSEIKDKYAPIDVTNKNTENLVETLLGSESDIASIAPDQFQASYRALQEMLRQSFNYGLVPRLDGYPELKEEAIQLAKLAENARKLKDWEAISTRFRGLLVRVELIGANEDGIKQDLLKLLKLLIDNISELVSDDQWLRGQIAVVQKIISSPLERALISDAEKSLREVIFKQGTLKHSLTEAKNAFKNMVATFVDRLGLMSSSTGLYQGKMKSYASQLAETEDIAHIDILLESLMRDTHTMQTDIVRSRDDLLQQRDQVDISQKTIQKLQEELSQLSEKVSMDQLTGIFNRRGLDEAMVREIARVKRGGTQMCVALLDIDNFKRLNDTYGHQVGDTALQHLAKVIKETIRPTDIAARFGGEEFVILLPDTGVEQAVETIARLQRTLTKQFFLGNNERLLITFSAGVSLFKPDEDQVAVLNRADQAMYLAKKSGKNRVMTEEDLLDINS